MLTDAIRNAIRDRLDRESRRTYPGIGARVRRVQERLASLPVLDPCPSDELLGYDEHGVPD